MGVDELGEDKLGVEEIGSTCRWWDETDGFLCSSVQSSSYWFCKERQCFNVFI